MPPCCCARIRHFDADAAATLMLIRSPPHSRSSLPCHGTAIFSLRLPPLLIDYAAMLFRGAILPLQMPAYAACCYAMMPCLCLPMLSPLMPLLFRRCLAMPCRRHFRFHDAMPSPYAYVAHNEPPTSYLYAYATSAAAAAILMLSPFASLRYITLCLAAMLSFVFFADIFRYIIFLMSVTPPPITLLELFTVTITPLYMRRVFATLIYC